MDWLIALFKLLPHLAIGFVLAMAAWQSWLVERRSEANFARRMNIPPCHRSPFFPIAFTALCVVYVLISPLIP